jgi:hypothetical protein
MNTGADVNGFTGSVFPSNRQDRNFIKDKLHGKKFLVFAFGSYHNLELMVSFYPADGSVAIQAMEMPTSPDDAEDFAFEPFGVLTVCAPPFGDSLGKHEILVKNWSENEQWTKSLLRSYPDVFEVTGKGVPMGFVIADVWQIK